MWIFLLLREKSERGEERRGRKGVVNEQGDKFGQGAVVCSFWRSLLQISFMVLLHGICFVRVPEFWPHEELIS